MLRVLIAAAAFATLATLAPAAHACSCGYNDFAERDAAIDLIVTARITAISPLESGRLDRHADIESIDIARGPQQTTFRIHYYQGNGVNCGARFTLGETVTVYATQRRDFYYSDYCLLPGTTHGEQTARWRALEAETRRR